VCPFITTNGGLTWALVRQGLRFGGNWDSFDFVSQRAGVRLEGSGLRPDRSAAAPVPSLRFGADPGIVCSAAALRRGGLTTGG
jgi:hypothetical protein